jgi:hypothetical protein
MSLPEDRTFILGKLAFTLAGRTPFFDALAEEFSPIRGEATDRAPQLVFRQVAQLDQIEGASLFLPVVVGTDRFTYAAGKCRYLATKTTHGLDVAVAMAEPKGLRTLIPDNLQRAAHYNFMNFWERRVKSFVYNAFDYLAQSCQVDHDQTFMHASSLERNGKALALLAWGGIGKTTSMLKLVLEDGWRFLSDDLGVLDADGVVSRSPKKMQIYGYNLVNQPKVTAAMMQGRSFLDRWSWKMFKVIKGNKRIRRRLSAEQLFGADRIARTAQLGQAIFLERHRSSSFVVETITPDALARRCTAVLLREISPYDFVASAVQGAGNRSVLPSVGEMEERARGIMVKAFSRVPCQLIKIPLQAGPDDLVAHLRSLLVI